MRQGQEGQGQQHRANAQVQGEAAFSTFVRGCPRIPAMGFQHFLGYNETIAWVESPAEGSELRDAYPRAQTCFNTLFLPAYGTDAEMETRLCTAIGNNTAGFDEAAVAAYRLPFQPGGSNDGGWGAMIRGWAEGS